MITLTFHGSNRRSIENDMLVYLGHSTSDIGHQEFITRETLLRSLVSDLELSVRTSNALKNEGIITLRELCSLSPTQLALFPNMGKRSVKEVREVLVFLGLWTEKR